jgi:hypothetical protein
LGQYTQSGNYLHDQACNRALAVLQSTIAGAAMSPSGQQAVNAGEIIWARAVIASCKANNNGAGAEAATSLLRALGTGGT